MGTYGRREHDSWVLPLQGSDALGSLVPMVLLQSDNEMCGHGQGGLRLLRCFGFGLGAAEHPPAVRLLLSLEAAPDHQGGSVEIEVVPAQPEGLALTKAQCQHHEPEGLKTVIRGGQENLPSLHRREGLRFLSAHDGRLHQSSNVARDQKHPGLL